jgi:mannose-6-phosphate isomerase-like protein (cupin superfamily)
MKNPDELSPCIRLFDSGKEFYIDEGCFVVEQTEPEEDPDLSIARCRLHAGKSTRWHRLRQTTERYVIVSGEGLVEIGSLPPTRLSSGDTVIIPALCPQRITNTGTEDLVFLALCTPRFIPDCYEDIEPSPATQPI